eukprot:SAG25_NODE_14550_length_253_cov_1.344156_1_plen_23_part_01
MGGLGTTAEAIDAANEQGGSLQV